MSKLAKALTAAAGNAAGESLYVEDVFSTYLYTGNGSTQTITNGIDLAGEGGLVWSKKRSGAEYHVLFDTEAQKRLETNSTNSGGGGYIPTYFNFLGDGYFMDWSAGGMPNDSGDTYASWTFRKAEKFFDVVTFTSASSGISTVSHNLGSVPACIIVKMTGSTGGWVVYHSGTDATSPQDKLLRLDLTNAASTSSGYFGSTGPTDSEFQVNINNNEPCVAYLFASDAGGFGDDGSESIIKCGSYTGNGNANGPEINLGFEPQFLMVKNASGGNWVIADTMRSFGLEDMASLYPNASNAESTIIAGKAITPTATGFKCIDANGATNQNTASHIYIAIRRPMKTPESGTEVFAVDDRAAATPAFVSDFPVDLYWKRAKTAGNFFDYARLRGDNYLQHDGTNAETSGPAFFDSNTGVGSSGSVSTNNLAWMFKRATGFFDVVAYTGDGATQATNHNLGVPPEMMIVKPRNSATTYNDWYVYHHDGVMSGQSYLPNALRLSLNSSSPYGGDTSSWGNTDPTSTVFTTKSPVLNQSSINYIAYLFATLAGVSKVGSYTGTGSNVDVDCGFSAGARFILIKRTDSTGDWYVYDYFRGIVSGNDPYLLLNTGAGQVTNTDYIDPLNAGFTVTSSAPAALNASGGTYIFMAIS